MIQQKLPIVFSAGACGLLWFWWQPFLQPEVLNNPPVGVWTSKTPNGFIGMALSYFFLSAYIGLEACWHFRLSRSLPALVWLVGVYGLLALLFLFEIARMPLQSLPFSWTSLGWSALGILLGGLPVLLRGAFLPTRGRPPPHRGLATGA